MLCQKRNIVSSHIATLIVSWWPDIEAKEVFFPDMHFLKDLLLLSSSEPAELCGLLVLRLPSSLKFKLEWTVVKPRADTRVGACPKPSPRQEEGVRSTTVALRAALRCCAKCHSSLWVSLHSLLVSCSVCKKDREEIFLKLFNRMK